MPCLFFAAKSKAYKSDPPAEITSQTYQHLELISICLMRLYEYKSIGTGIEMVSQKTIIVITLVVSVRS